MEKQIATTYFNLGGCIMHIPLTHVLELQMCPLVQISYSRQVQTNN